LKHEDFIPKISDIWKDKVVGKDAVDKWCIKMNRVKKFLKGWGMSLKGHNKKYKKCLREELAALEKVEEERPLPAHLLKRKTFILSENSRLLEEEELYWHKRSNNKWLLERDLNTGFFHRIANGKKKHHLKYLERWHGGGRYWQNSRFGYRLLQRSFWPINKKWY